MAPSPPQDDASEFELAIDDDLLAAAVAAVEARMDPPAPPAPDPEAEAAFAADLELDLGDLEAPEAPMDADADDEAPLEPPPDGPTDELGIDLLLDEDEPSPEPPASRDGTLDLLLAELTSSRAALAAAEARAESMESELIETAEALANETQERRRATAIAVRLKERAQRSDLLVANARSGRAAAEERIAELETAITRMETERERIRERRRRELEDARQHGLAPTLKELIPVLDHLEMAVAHASAEPEKLVEGVRMIVGQFTRALGARGVTRVGADTGTPFDPERHEALQRVETTAHAPGVVLDELRAGYMLNGRLLRAARVTVAAAPSAPAVDDDPTTGDEPPSSDPPSSEPPSSEPPSSEPPSSDPPEDHTQAAAADGDPPEALEPGLAPPSPVESP